MKKLLLIGIFSIFSASANAAILTYQLHDVVFDDGSTASGSFDWEFNVPFTNISITTTAGSARNYAVTYTETFNPGVLGINFGVTLASHVGNDTSYWNISFEPDGPTDGSYYLTSATSRPIAYQAYGENDSNHLYNRYVVSGYVAPIPVPATLWLFGTSLAALCLGKRRR